MCLGDNLERKRERICREKCSKLPYFHFFFNLGVEGLNGGLACFPRLDAPLRCTRSVLTSAFLTFFGSNFDRIFGYVDAWPRLTKLKNCCRSAFVRPLAIVTTLACGAPFQGPSRCVFVCVSHRASGAPSLGGERRKVVYLRCYSRNLGQILRDY